MSRDTTLKRILDGGIVAVVRFEASEPLVKVVEALARGGVTAAEVTFTVPDAIDVIRQVRRQVGDSVVLGAGTVLDSETARAAILAGAEYIVSPIVNLDVIRLCRRYDKVVMPGAFTPTEVVSAWEAGADLIKIFPEESICRPPRVFSKRALAVWESAVRLSTPKQSPQEILSASASSRQSLSRSLLARALKHELSLLVSILACNDDLYPSFSLSICPCGLSDGSRCRQINRFHPFHPNIRRIHFKLDRNCGR
jgi:2-keto-3-deoxy-6-phosphogluconate aldolase